MGDLTPYYNKSDFICRCSDCKGQEYRIHLGLVGILEALGAHYRKTPRIVSAYWCDAYNEKNNFGKKSFHTQGKAVHINIDGVPLNEVFKYIEQNFPEINGIGYSPEENFVHIDTRRNTRDLWVREKGKQVQLTPEKRIQYNL